jgi:hypothetical protein
MEIFGVPTTTIFLSGWTVEHERRSDADVRPIELSQTQGWKNGVAINFNHDDLGAAIIQFAKPRKIS